jgi:putative ABC transport system permease protein
VKLLARSRLALRLLMRDWRAGELGVLVAALVIAVAASTTIAFFTDRLGRGMVNQSSEFLGADLILRSPRPVDPDWLEEATQRGLQVTQTLEFASVVVSDDALQLAQVKAVQSGFPLRGTLRTAAAPFAPEQPSDGVPPAGEAWAAAELLSRLGIAVGARVSVGEQALRISRVLTFEPGQGGAVFGFSPRLLMNQVDVAATGVVQPGSRLSYQYLFAGGETVLQRYRAWLRERLGPSHRLLGIREGQRAVGTALQRAERFLGLSVLAAIVLSGIAIAMAARRYSQRHFDMSAMLRCLGASQSELLGLYLPQLAVLAVLASAAGCLLGWLAQHGLLYLLADLLPVAPSGSRAGPLLTGLATGLVALAGFALPPVMRLRDVPPLRVLRRDLLPLPASAWLVYGTALTAVVVLMWRYTGNGLLTLSVLAGGAAVLGLLAALGMLLLWLGRKLNRKVGVTWRFGLNNLWRHRETSLSQMLAFGLTLMAMATVALVRTDLLTTWQRQLPADVPNHFAVNILPEQVEALGAVLDSRGIVSSQLYPLVRGRLVSINGQAVREAVSKEKSSHNALNRELNLSWSTELQEDNAIISGDWWEAADYSQPLVSVEQQLAERLGIQLGDRLGFRIGADTLIGRVSSIRSVQWDSFRPNFYMLFPPGVLERFPATYMTSFYLQPQDKPLLRELLGRFPALTILEMDLIIEQVGRIFRQATLAVEYVLVFVLLAGFAVLFAALQATLDERLRDGALLRALGGSRRQLRRAQLAEFASLGLLSGLAAACGTECLAWALYSQVMQLDYSFKWPVWIVTPLAGALLVGAAGYWGTRPVLERSPLLLLRQE